MIEIPDVIYRKDAINAINKAFERVFEWDGTSPLGEKVLANVPSVQPERKGKWIENKYEYIVCSECDYPALKVMTGCLTNRHLEQYETDFCPNCGADMRGGQE